MKRGIHQKTSLFSRILSYLQPQNKTLAAIMEAFHTSAGNRQII